VRELIIGVMKVREGRGEKKTKVQDGRRCAKRVIRWRVTTGEYNRYLVGGGVHSEGGKRNAGRVERDEE